MASVNVIDSKGKTTASVEVSTEIFGHPGNKNLYYETVKANLNAARQGTVSTKTRGEVRGGKTKKPWRQKGTGRARAGSIVSPLWRGGGIIFGPRPKEYDSRVPRKVRRGAIFSALSEALRDGRLKVVESFPLEDAKTKAIASFLSAIGCGGTKTLILYDSAAEPLLLRCARNIDRVNLSHYGRLNIVELLWADNIVLSRGTLDKLQGVFQA